MPAYGCRGEGMENGFEKDFAVVWPPIGIGDMQGGIGRIRMPAQNLNHFTAATGPAIVRGDKLPADLKGDFLFTEPVGRLCRRAGQPFAKWLDHA